MSKFLVLYKGSDAGHEQVGEPSAEQQQAMMQSWFDWRDSIADAIVDFGAPTTQVGDGTASGIGGYSIVQADSVDALPAIFATNPHRQQGGALEFHQIVEMPGM
ncbi:hypothetical protein HNP40_002852 [Mycobacteroides chelonae]|nr:hypothetical protein [Mycobacteroides chelonae]